MSGVDRRTGELIDNYASACQAVEVIFSTPIGERVMRRQFGGGLVELLGRLVRPELLAAFTMVAAAAIDVWEPRFKVRAVRFTGSIDDVRSGRAGLAIEVDWRPYGHLGNYKVESVRELVLRFTGHQWSAA